MYVQILYSSVASGKLPMEPSAGRSPVTPPQLGLQTLGDQRRGSLYPLQNTLIFPFNSTLKIKSYK